MMQVLLGARLRVGLEQEHMLTVVLWRRCSSNACVFSYMDSPAEGMLMQVDHGVCASSVFFFFFSERTELSQFANARLRAGSGHYSEEYWLKPDGAVLESALLVGDAVGLM